RLGEFIVCAIPSTLELVKFFNVDRIQVAEQQHQNRQADGRFGSSHCQDKEDENLSGRVTEPGGEGYEIHVGREQDKLDGHQQNDEVAAVQEKTEYADGEQYGAKYQVLSQRQCHCFSPGAAASVVTEGASVCEGMLTMRKRS